MKFSCCPLGLFKLAGAFTDLEVLLPYAHLHLGIRESTRSPNAVSRPTASVSPGTYYWKCGFASIKPDPLNQKLGGGRTTWSLCFNKSLVDSVACSGLRQLNWKIDCGLDKFKREKIVSFSK